MIRVLIVDDHPAIRSGLIAALRTEPGLIALAEASGVSAALEETQRGCPDVALVDYQLPDGDGLLLCHELKLLADSPAVVLYSAFARRELPLAAALAGADAMVDKGSPLGELFDTIRAAGRGGRRLPALRPGVLKSCLARLEAEDRPIVDMRLKGATLSEIASVLGVEEGEISSRLVAMLWRLLGRSTHSPTGDRNL